MTKYNLSADERADAARRAVSLATRHDAEALAVLLHQRRRRQRLMREMNMPRECQREMAVSVAAATMARGLALDVETTP